MIYTNIKVFGIIEGIGLGVVNAYRLTLWKVLVLYLVAQTLIVLINEKTQFEK